MNSSRRIRLSGSIDSEPLIELYRNSAKKRVLSILTHVKSYFKNPLIVYLQRPFKSTHPVP